jgi:hypothetical protein
MSVNLNPVGDTINEPYLIIDNFLASHVAGNMRADIEQHFADPFAHLPQSHQVWNYWYVPGQYTYFRTNAEKVVHHERVEYFLSALRNWSTRTLGLSKITRPYLSLYMNGCSQKWHNDALNGRFAFVYSLTANERKSSGGGTVIMNEGDHFRNHLTSPAAGSAFFVEIEPVFNRLIVFDDRIPHAVEPVLSSMDPLDGRFVLHGHISEGESQVEGGSDPGEVSSIMTSAADIVFSKYSLASIMDLSSFGSRWGKMVVWDLAVWCSIGSSRRMTMTSTGRRFAPPSSKIFGISGFPSRQPKPQ